MVFKFRDKQNTIKHLSFILETKNLNTQTLVVKETYGGGTISSDMLFYDNEKLLMADINKLYKELKAFTEAANNMQKLAGFIEEAEGEDAGD